MIRYGPPDEPDRFEYRLPNPAHYPHQRIDRVVMHDRPEWVYDQARRVNRAAVVFTARHIGQKPARGFFELDAEGFPRGGRYRGNLYQIITKSTLAKIQKLRESALIGRRAFATTRGAADSAPALRGRTPHRMLRYRFNEGRTYQVTSEKISEVSGIVSGRPVVIRKTVKEYLTVQVRSVDGDGAATIGVVPDRYDVLLETSIDEKITQSERLDTNAEDSPESVVLRHFESRMRPHLRKNLTFTAGRRGLLKPASDSSAADEFQLFRTIQCGFQSPLLPLFPEDSFPADGGWEEQSTLGGTRTVQSSWWADLDAKQLKPGQSAYRGQGDFRTVDANGQSTIATAFTATMRLTEDELLPASLEVKVDEAPIFGSVGLQDARHRVTENLKWERIERTPEESE